MHTTHNAAKNLKNSTKQLAWHLIKNEGHAEDTHTCFSKRGNLYTLAALWKKNKLALDHTDAVLAAKVNLNVQDILIWNLTKLPNDRPKQKIQVKQVVTIQNKK
jgi:hypothetical protein